MKAGNEEINHLIMQEKSNFEVSLLNCQGNFKESYDFRFVLTILNLMIKYMLKVINEDTGAILMNVVMRSLILTSNNHFLLTNDI